MVSRISLTLVFLGGVLLCGGSSFFGSRASFAADCNRNAIDDLTDLGSGSSEDCNGNQVPDECEFAPLEFGPREGGEADFPVARSPLAAVAADFSGDGLVDLATGNQAGRSSISLLLSRGDRTFEPAVDFEAGQLLSSMTARDLDGDGDVDLATANRTRVLVLENRGGGFSAPVEFSVASETRFVIASDVTGDGVPDLVTASAGEDTVSVLENQGTGTFGTPVEFGVGSHPISVAPADLDGDGALDLAVANRNSADVSVLRGLGGGSFAAAVSYEVGGEKPFSVVGGDLDGDGALDLAAATVPAISVLLGDGSGTLSAPVSYTSSPSSLAAGDLDGDGDLDLAYGSVRSRLVSVLVGDGGGRFSPVDFQVPDVGWVLSAADLDGDDDLDLAASVMRPDRIGVLWNGVAGAASLLSFRPPQTFDTAGAPHTADLGDLDGDGYLDVVTGNNSEGISVLMNEGDGTFPRTQRYSSGGNSFSIVAVDLDGDTDLDLASADLGSHRLQILLNTGDGTYGQGGDYGVLGDPFHLTVADLNGDGFCDVLSSNQSSNTLSLLLNTGDGSFASAEKIAVGSGPVATAAFDLDGDGDIDLAASNQGSSELMVLENGGTGSFAAPVNYPTVSSPSFVAAGDLDRDGHVDLAASESDGSVSVFWNAGDGTFGPALSLPIGGRPRSLILADLSGDDRPDLVTANYRHDTFSTLVDRGGRLFFPAVEHRTGSGPRFVVAGDLDGDATLDVVIPNHIGKDMMVFLNTTQRVPPTGEYLEVVCTYLDFQKVSVPSVGGGSGERLTKYVLPARDNAALLSTLFQNVNRHPLHENLLREVFPERFGDLSKSGFTDLALRRATRDYFVGTVLRLRLEDGSLVYGFDVLTETAAPGELLALEETRDVFARLRESFLLEPLVYVPSTPQAREAASDWDAPDLPIIIVEDEEPPVKEPPANPTFLLEIPAQTVLCGVFAVAGVERGPRDEYELKSIVRLREGTVVLPSENETFTAELFEEVLFGSTLVTAEPTVVEGTASGTFRVVRLPPELGSDVTTYRFTYSQLFRFTDDGINHELELEVVAPLLYRARGDDPLAESRTLPEEYFVVLKGSEPLQAKLDDEPLVRYGSCSYESLPLWGIEAELEDGTLLFLEERFEAVENVFATAPASVVRADVTLAGERRVVTDYVDLVYSAARHNTRVDYWVLLDPPVTVADVGEVHGVELQAPEVVEPPRDATAAYLGANLEMLSTVPVVRFSRQEKQVFFRRGDANSDGTLNVLDVLVLLDHIFRKRAAARGESLSCLKAGDANDDGRLNIVDPLALVAQLFGGRGGLPEALPEPFGDCGSDPTEDTLSCHSAPSCR